MRNHLLYCATDKEIHDVLMSSKQRITDAVMLELARDRGIFFSPKDSRESLAHSLSLLPHDYHDLNVILGQRETHGRAEKTTSITLNAELTLDDIKEISREYKEQAPQDEKVVTHQNGTDKYVVNVEYTEVDYSKTRLIQRKPREAGIEFIVNGDKTTIRMPANAKARDIVANLKQRLDSRKKTEISTTLIELSEFNTAEARTRFFTMLISKLPGFKLDNVTSVKVEPISREFNEDELDLEDDQNKEEAKQEALALVKKVALNGESLLASDEYQALQKKGFYITSIIWRSKQLSSPYPIVEFEAAFEEPEAGRGFKYSVRGAMNFLEGEYTKTLRPLASDERQRLIMLIEQTASQALSDLYKSEEKEKEEKPLAEAGKEDI